MKIDIRSEVYNALTEVMFRSHARKEDMDYAIEWFQTHFYEDESEYDD